MPTIWLYEATSSVTLRVPPFRGPTSPFSLKTVHRTVFRALEPP